MKYTDNAPVMLKNVMPQGASNNPIFVSNHSVHGFNVRHFYFYFQTGTFKATKKGVSVEPGSVLELVKGMVTFINENDVVEGHTLTLTVSENE